MVIVGDDDEPDEPQHQRRVDVSPRMVSRIFTGLEKARLTQMSGIPRAPAARKKHANTAHGLSADEVCRLASGAHSVRASASVVVHRPPPRQIPRRLARHSTPDPLERHRGGPRDRRSIAGNTPAAKVPVENSGPSLYGERPAAALVPGRRNYDDTRECMPCD